MESILPKNTWDEWKIKNTWNEWKIKNTWNEWKIKNTWNEWKIKNTWDKPICGYDERAELTGKSKDGGKS